MQATDFRFYSQWVIPGKVDAKARYNEGLLSWQPAWGIGHGVKVIYHEAIKLLSHYVNWVI